VKIPADVVAYLLKLAEASKERYELKVQITEARVRIAAKLDDTVFAMLAGGEAGALKEIVDLMSDETNVEAFMETLNTTDSRAKKSSSSGGGGGSDKWKTNKTAKLEALLVTWLEENHARGEPDAVRRRRCRRHVSVHQEGPDFDWQQETRRGPGQLDCQPGNRPGDASTGR
jgi:hypothetical protein